MLDDQTEFVDVSSKHKGWCSFASQSRMATTQGINRKSIRNFFDPFPYNFTGFLLKTRWGSGIE
jgi:hypothetical protein